MPNEWINHIRQWAKDHNTSYGCALSNPKCTEDYHKRKKTPNNTIKPKEIEKEIKVRKTKERNPKNVIPIIKEDDDVFDYDIKSAEFQRLIIGTPTEEIRKALAELGYRGKIETNKILQTMQLVKNFNTMEKMQTLIDKLK
jgi:hypothetical protein